MTSPKRTFREWEKSMSKKILDVQEARRSIIGVVLSTPLRQTAEEKLVAIDGLKALEEQLREELRKGTRKHIKRMKTMCETCGEKLAEWKTANGDYLCTDCACKQCDVNKSVPWCKCCGRDLHGVVIGCTGALYCSMTCALKDRGCEPMTEKEEGEL